VFAGVPFPELRPEPQVSPTAVRFVQTAGGRTGLPAPRRVRRKPFFQLAAPPAWSTLALTLGVDGSSEYEVVGASPFPRHWIYDGSGRLVLKTGMVDFSHWYRRAFGRLTPWGEEDAPALVTLAETALERELSRLLMREGQRPKIQKAREGRTLVAEGEAGTDIFLVLDGVLAVEVGGAKLGEVGPGAILGERAVLEGGIHTSTLRAVTPCKIAVAPAASVDPGLLAEVAARHRREDTS
ncbi:MAG: cyclic nucleotide-binding domain-containing protein, partial [Actinomycetota bacterium]|nr:cyclic nucleotide-binding domain-containing protein [Actinomycetota bacterium]